MLYQLNYTHHELDCKIKDIFRDSKIILRGREYRHFITIFVNYEY